MMKPTFKYQKKPRLPVTLNSSKTELLFLPLKQSRYWTLIVSYEIKITQQILKFKNWNETIIVKFEMKKL